MPAASNVVRQYARNYTFAFNLDIARPVFERAPDGAIVTCCARVLHRLLNGYTSVRPGRLKHIAAAYPEQGIYKESGNVERSHKQCISDVI